jgi:hypothetical protein
MHPQMKSDPEIEKWIDSSRDQLKRPIPYWKMLLLCRLRIGVKRIC